VPVFSPEKFEFLRDCSASQIIKWLISTHKLLVVGLIVLDRLHLAPDLILSPSKFVEDPREAEASISRHQRAQQFDCLLNMHDSRRLS
jgi:hypothetical protein